LAARVRKSTHDRKSDRQGAILSLVLAVAVLAVYWQVGQFGFIGYDDPEFVLNNPHIRQGLTPAAIAWAFTTGYAANWFPVTWLSYLLGVNLYGLAPGWHHLTNVFLHALNSVLLFALLRRMTGARWPSFFAALLFAVHPLHVEAVAWIAERRELLSGLFWFLSILAWLRYIERSTLASYLLLLGAFACGLMSKPDIVALPFALLLLDYWPLGRWKTTAARSLILEKLPLVALSAASCAVTLLVQQGGGATASLAEVPFRFRLENAVVSYAAYVWQFFWPARLAVLYPYDSNLPAWQVAGAAAALAAITALAVVWRRRRPYLFTGWFWFAGILVPTIGLVQVGVQARADRYMYIPMIGLSLAAVWSAAELAARRPAVRSLAVAAGVSACCVYGVAAWSTAAYWRDTVDLFRHTVAVTTDNWAALTTLSQALLSANRAEEAMPYVTEALGLRPNLAEAHINYGSVLRQRGELDAAAAEYRRALASDPNNPDAREGLGIVSSEKGDAAGALANLTAAEKSRPDDPDMHYNLGRVYGLSGRFDRAAAEFAETVRLEPASASAHYNLGIAYANQDRFAEARGEFLEAVRLKPNYTAAHFSLGGALANLNRFDEAIGEFEEVLRLEPGSADAAAAIQNCLQMKKAAAR
jgi:protein O-mannosyl-transferase